MRAESGLVIPQISSLPRSVGNTQEAFVSPAQWSIFHDASGTIGAEDIIVQANIWCRTSDIATLAYELEHNSCLGDRSYHYADMTRRSIQRRTAKAWGQWYIEEGHKMAPFGIRVFKVNPLVFSSRNEPVFKTYNRQAKEGLLEQLSYLFDASDSIEIQGFLDSDETYCELPTGSDITDNNLPVYLSDAICYHSRNDVSRQMYPKVFIQEPFTPVKRKDRPKDRGQRYIWRILQLADFMAGICYQAVTASSKDKTKCSFGNVFRTIVDSQNFNSTRCVFNSVDIGTNYWNPKKFEPFVVSFPGSENFSTICEGSTALQSYLNN